MGVPCPRCGRQYDVTLFQFGRTIHCTCGSRVGRESRVRLPEQGGPPSFLTDAMLGRLTRWLRILGYDAAHDPALDDRDLVRRADREGRWLLTRDTRLPREWRIEGCLVLESEEPLGQVEEIRRRLELGAPPGLFSRCTLCNAELEPATPEMVGEGVPEAVRETHDAFTRCPECGKVYWRGSHTRRIRARLEELD